MNKNINLRVSILPNLCLYLKEMCLFSATENSQQYHAPRTKIWLGDINTIILWKYIHVHIIVSGCDYLFIP